MNLFSRFQGLLVGLAAALLACLCFPQFLRGLGEDLAKETWFRLATAESAPRAQVVRVTVVEMDPRAVGRWGGSWPLEPREMSRVLRAIDRLKPAVIGLDAQYLKLQGKLPEGADELIATIKESGRVILKDRLMGESSGMKLASADEFQAAARGRGVSRFNETMTGSVRSTTLDDESYCLALLRGMSQGATVMVDPSGIQARFHDRGVYLPTSGEGALEIDYRLLPRLQRISMEELATETGTSPYLTDRIVLIAPSLSPLTPLHQTPTGERLPEAYLDALALESLTSGDGLRSVRPFDAWVIFGAVLAVVLVSTVTLRLIAGMCVLLLVICGWGLWCYAAFRDHGVEVELVRPIFAYTIAAMSVLALRLYERLVIQNVVIGRKLGGSWASRKLLQKGSRMIRHKKHVEAIELVQKAMALDPQVKMVGLQYLLLSHLGMRQVDMVGPILDQLDLEMLDNEKLYEMTIALRDEGLIEHAIKVANVVSRRDVNFKDILKVLEELRNSESDSDSEDLIESSLTRMLSRDFNGARLLKRGGMSLVFSAFSPQHGRNVAIKVLSPHLASDEGVVFRFLHEADALRQFTHPNIVKVLDVYRTGKIKYFVMENIQPAVPLNDVMEQEHKLTLERALQIVKQVLDALEYSHGRGVIHRDIKPSNIMVGIGDAVKLIDYGIARFTSKPRSTTTGTVLGTPRYMSPEQYKGEKVSPTTDVYSVAVTLFELLTGETGTENPMVERMQGKPTVQQIILRQNLPTPLVAIILRALEIRPEKRFPSAIAFRQEIEKFENTPVEFW